MKEWCLNVHQSVFGILVKQKSKHFSLAWLYATGQLKPGKGYQLVDFSEADKNIKKAVPALVSEGLLKPKKDSASKFYVPRSLAFASMEDSFKGIQWKLDGNCEST